MPKSNKRPALYSVLRNVQRKRNRSAGKLMKDFLDLTGHGRIVQENFNEPEPAESSAFQQSSLTSRSESNSTLDLSKCDTQEAASCIMVDTNSGINECSTAGVEESNGSSNATSAAILPEDFDSRICFEESNKNQRFLQCDTPVRQENSEVIDEHSVNIIQNSNDIYFRCFDSSINITLVFDCEICIRCKCQACEKCSHTDGISCEHCEYCRSSIDSDIEDEESDNESDDGYYDVDNSELLSESDKCNNQIRNEFVDIVLKRDITQGAVDDLLQFFRRHKFGKFPKCAKTLLKTPVVTETREVAPGVYWHRGLREDIVDFAMRTGCYHIEVSFGIDGLPLAKSSNICFWPICCSFNNSAEVYLAGLYCGLSKPSDPNEYLKDFVEEMNELIENGIECNGKLINVKVHLAICDAPAKAFILNVKGHSGYFSCCKCTEEGFKYGGRMAFHELKSKLRTDESFINQEQENHHLGDALLTSLNGFLPVTNVPLDYMHLVLLGCLRKMIYMLIGGPLNVRQASHIISRISECLVSLAPWVPKEFVRKTRSLEYVKRFKATEWRMLLFYVGIVVLSVLPKHLYQHFLVLHVAMTILAHPHLSQTHWQYAKSLMIYFIKNFKLLYGKEYVSYNIHNLAHLADDVQIHGSVDNFSAFKYENFLQALKRMIRKGEKPLQQVHRRYEELKKKTAVPPSQSGRIVFSGLHCNGPLLPGCTNPQYSALDNQKLGLKLSVSPADCCCALQDGSIILLENIAQSKENTTVLIGRKFLSVKDLYTIPCNSSLLGIHRVSALSSLSSWPLESFKSKCFRIPFEEDFAVIPLLHCDM